jgi:glycosyltransferase involved in cell wall biosynthesis
MIVFIGSHLGYPMDRTPLGGGAMVGLRLVRHWAAGGLRGLTVLGSGLEAPAAGVEYVRLPAGPGYDLVRLSEFEYARFCRDFEAATTDWLLARRDRLPPAETTVLVNDVSEGPTLSRLAGAGYPIVSLWHVDVVDYFNKLYLYSLVPPQRLTRLYERCRRLGLSGAAPDLLQLIFEKQRETVARSARLIVPSRAMAETLGRCYEGETPGGGLAERIRVAPWGAFSDDTPEPPEAGLRELHQRYRIDERTTVLMTLSRIAPEKGIHLLIEALRRLEDQGRLAGRDVALLICGEASFMRGAAYFRRVRAAAAALRQVRAFFPGYLDAAAKKAHCRLAQLFVSPSVHESYGLNLVEAMQAGLAVLASDHYGVREILHESCGLVVPYPSLDEAPRRLAEALEPLLSDRGRLAAMGRAARERAATMPFSRAADAVLRACQEVLDPAGRAVR